mmetsp:Transcript_11739/g.25065  ORF Transcript_11739/g.25065 Transcript_11739/m.25065 type:complete len:207 (+) Transcript_11739:633-1253(+)
MRVQGVGGAHQPCAGRGGWSSAPCAESRSTTPIRRRSRHPRLSHYALRGPARRWRGVFLSCVCVTSLQSPTTERLLHPRHVLLFTSHATLINCTNALDDYYAAVKSSRVVVSCLELCGLAPSTETADFSDTLGQAIDRLLASRKLPRKTAQQLREEMAETLYRATHVRSVCMGPNHPATQHAMATLESLCPRHPLVEKARDLLVGE